MGKNDEGQQSNKVADLGAPTDAPPVPNVSPLALRVMNSPHEFIREMALAAAKVCESPKLVPISRENVRRLLRVALAALE